MTSPPKENSVPNLKSRKGPPLFFQIFEQAPIPYFLVETDGTITQSNKAASYLFLGNLTGTPIADLYMDVNDKKLNNNNFFKRFENNTFPVSEESEYRKLNGDSFWGSLSITPLYNDSGEVIVWLFTLLDITSQKNAYQQQKQEFEHKLAQLTEELETITSALQKARKREEVMGKAKSDFLANMSHEFRTPLHAILRSAEKGMKRMGKDDPEKFLQRFTKIYESGHRLLTLVENTLDLSKLEARKMVFEMKILDLIPVVQKALDILEELITPNRVKITKKTNETQGYFDENTILQVILNLLSNALKFSQDHQTIVICFEDCLIPGRRKSDPTTPGVAMKVIDQGIGIPDNELETVFDKFMQSSKTKTGAGGTGLGLPICKEIIQEHRGRIWAEPNPNGGSIFTVQLHKSPIINRPTG